MCQEDLDNMNKCVEKVKGTMMLWCDGKSAALLVVVSARKRPMNHALQKDNK